MPVACPRGLRRKVITEVTDAPMWSGDLFIYTKRRYKTRAVTAFTTARKLKISYAEQKSTKR
jgi:hypothetical protein